jgi:anaerobic magnesium-protoporphyrin IX monomethyl ester cyclase
MNITLISLDHELFCIGIRILSACLREAGHDVRCIFLPPNNKGKKKVPKFQMEYGPQLMDDIHGLCKEADLIGMSLMTNQFIQAVRVTGYLKKKGVNAPIVWGGIHPTVEPAESIKHADIICRGEGEDALLELVSKMELGHTYLETRNFWFSLNKKVLRNPVRPLEQDLDKLPFPDYRCENHFIADGDHLEILTRENLTRYRGERFNARGREFQYTIMTSRGCPFRCTYCCNDVYKDIYRNQKRLRWRGVDSIISELKMVQKTVAPISFVMAVDDNFTARPDEEMERLCERYRSEIGVPFFCQCSPLTITAKKMEMLIKAGCAKITMGVETASERVAKAYNRERFHKALPAAISLIEGYRGLMPRPPTYQFIIDNPYETLDETLETLRFALALPKPWDNPIYSLMLFPGTTLYKQALRDGLISDKFTQIYGRNWLDQKRPFFQFWIRLYRANMPRPLLNILLKPLVARILTSRIADLLWKMPLFRRLWQYQG